MIATPLLWHGFTAGPRSTFFAIPYLPQCIAY
jgi:hypothetical protein